MNHLAKTPTLIKAVRIGDPGVLEDGKSDFVLCSICAVPNNVSTMKALLQVGCDGRVLVTPERRFPISRSVRENGL
jgi:hypothetical protein